MMKLKYPIYFEGNTCIRCGCNGSLTFRDRMGQESRRPIYPICKMVCLNCNTEYFVRWIRNDNDKMIPICVGKDEVKQFEDGIVKFAMESRRKPL